jgi:hypothetical protein
LKKKKKKKDAEMKIHSKILKYNLHLIAILKKKKKKKKKQRNQLIWHEEISDRKKRKMGT